MAVTNAFQRWAHLRPKTQTAILLACFGFAAVLGAAFVLSSPPEQHCVASGAIQVVNSVTGEIIDPGTEPRIRCFSSYAEAANYGSGGALSLPRDASHEEVIQALENRPLP